MLESQSWKNKIVTKNGRLKRWSYLPKLLIITITSFNFFNCPVKLLRNLKLKLRSKFNHDLTNHYYLHSAVWKSWHNFKLKRTQGARHNQFFFRNVQNNEIFETFKMFKNMFKVKFDTKTDSNMQNSMLAFIFFYFRLIWIWRIQ